MIKNKQLSFEKKLYFTLLPTIPIIMFSFLRFDNIVDILNKYNTLCFFKEYLHIYCFGCGATRAIQSITQFKFFQSFLYNPTILAIFVLYILFMISHTISLFNKNYQGMEIKPIYAKVIVAIMIINFIIKNTLLFLHLPTFL